MPYIIQIHYLELPYLITAINLHRGMEWVGSFLKNFQKGGEDTI